MTFLLAVTLVSFMPPDAALVKASDLAGAWSGTITHDSETTPVGLELEPGDDGKVLIKLSAPVIHTLHAPLGRAPFEAQGNEIRLGPFVLTYDRSAGTLAGTIPEGLAPVYELPFTLRRVERLDLPARPQAAAAPASPAWTFDAGSPLWPGTSFAAGLVYAGADDGVLYALGAADGKERWRKRVGDKPVVRLPPSDPKSRFDRLGSDATVAGGRLYLGVHDGRVLCLDASDGKPVWQYASGDSVLAAPAVEKGRVYFGSYDGSVYALEAASGTMVWKRDTGKPVVSTPAVAGDRVIVGSRSYDLLGLDAKSGASRR